MPGVLTVSPEGPRIGSERDAADIVGQAFEQGAAWVALPVERLGPDFFRLSTRIAGEVIQKFITYRFKVAVVGDISAYVADSDALRDFVYESNRGQQVWFVADQGELARRLAAIAS
nr:DUF4180 domain-containing protein [Phenylobacterium aquaticum]